MDLGPVAMVLLGLFTTCSTGNKSAFKAIGLDDPISHDEHYKQAMEFFRLLYKKDYSSAPSQISNWSCGVAFDNGFWDDDAVVPNLEEDASVNPDSQNDQASGKRLRSRLALLLEPLPQQTPFLPQTSTSSPGVGSAALHAVAIFVSGSSPALVG